MSLPISVISFNVMGSPLDPYHIRKTLFRTKIRERHRKAADLMNTSDADVIALQEVYTYAQLMIFKKLLKAYPYITFEPFILGPKGGCVIFSKVKMKKEKFILFEKKGGWFDKSIIWHLLRNGILVTRLSEYPIYIFNTHLTANLDFDWSKENKYTPYIVAQLQQMKEVISSYGKNSIVIAAGDYNTDKKSPLYQNFMQSADVRDVLHSSHIASYNAAFMPDGKNPPSVDYIFVYDKERKMDISSAEYIYDKKVAFENGQNQYVSDHYAIHTKLLYNVNRQQL